MPAEPGDVILQEEGAAHAAIIVRTAYGLSLAHASTTGLKTTSPDKKPFHLFRCRNRTLAAAAAAQAEKWCTRIIWGFNQGDLELMYVPFAEPAREQRVSQLQHERDQVRSRVTGEALTRLTAPSTGIKGLFGIAPPSVAEALPQADIEGMKALMKFQDEQFLKFGRFRAIKYAARRDLSVTHVEYDNSNEKGYTVGPSTTCAMFVTLCFQAAGLAHVVDACSTFSQDSWVSNKHGAVLDYQLDDPVSMRNFNLYMSYLIDEYGPEHIRVEANTAAVKSSISTPVSPRTRKSCRSPLSVWHGGFIDSFDFSSAFTRAMCVDAKRVRATELLARCASDKQGWEYQGFFKWGDKATVQPVRNENQVARLDPLRYR